MYNTDVCVTHLTDVCDTHLSLNNREVCVMCYSEGRPVYRQESPPIWPRLWPPLVQTAPPTLGTRTRFTHPIMDGLEKLILLALVVLLAEVDEEDDGLRRQQLFAYGVSAVGVSLRSGMQSFVFATRFVHVFSARVSSMCFQLVFRA